VHNRDHKSSPLDPTLNQSHPVHILTPAYFFKICFNVILPSMPTSLKWYLPFPYLPFPSLPFGFSNRKCACLTSMLSTCPVQLIFLHVIILIISGME